MAVKAAAAAALERAEAAGKAAVEGKPYNLRRSRGFGRSSVSLPPVAGRSGSSHHPPGAPPWDPLGPKDWLAKFLRASSELHDVHLRLDERRKYEAILQDHFATLDRQLSEVEKTRKMIAAACGGRLPGLPHESSAADVGSESQPSARDPGTGGVAGSNNAGGTASAGGAAGGHRRASSTGDVTSKVMVNSASETSTSERMPRGVRGATTGGRNSSANLSRGLKHQT
mmetsp:Transcript_6462/g.12394  ORF Transcript_6462/g.12394 Transcript_6462/m.12394 type:complete len:227 (-) Transcript_6462:19-699(-)